MDLIYSDDFIKSHFIEQVKGYAIFAMDKNGIVSSWNIGAEKLKGYKEEEIIGEFYGVLFPDEYLDANKPVLELESALREGIYETEAWRRRKDGSFFWASIILTPIFNAAGEHIGFTKVTGDITRQKELQDKLAEKQQNTLEEKNSELKKINLDLDNFIYTASHDLRSPITNIEALTNLLKDELQESDSLNEVTEEVLSRISSSVERFKQTISDLTEISRLQKDITESIADETINIKEVYDDIVADLGPVNGDGCFIQTNFGVHQINFSKKNFRSILYNLLSNATKYQDPERACVIKIETKLKEPYVLLTIEDNGVGLNQRHQEQLFTMFKRFHDHVEGTGVGLYMVKRIVENAGGKIEVKSKEGTGSEFRIYLRS